MKRILVTGGAGFIGSNFIHYMLETYPEIQIVNLDKLTYAGNLDNLKNIADKSRYSFFQGDIADRQLVLSLSAEKKFDAIVNFAAETHVDRSINKPDDFLKTDIFGPFALLEATRQHNIKRFVQISTDEVYGPIKEGQATESFPLKPSSPYSASKSGGDMLTLAYFTTYNLDVVITRAANNYGAYQYPEKFIPLFVTNAMEDLPLPLYGDGSQVREWLYVDDHCRAIDTVLHHGKAGEIYNVGGYCEAKNIDIAKEIVKLLKKPEELIKFVDDRPGHDSRYAVDCSKLKQLGWEPKVSLEEGMANTVNWYKKNKDWWQKLKSGDFKDYYKKQYGERLSKAGA